MARSVLLSSCAFALILAAPGRAEKRFFPEEECTPKDRGAYPWDYEALVDRYIAENFYDPHSVLDLKIYKPATGWWTTAASSREDCGRATSARPSPT